MFRRAHRLLSILTSVASRSGGAIEFQKRRQIFSPKRITARTNILPALGEQVPFTDMISIIIINRLIVNSCVFVLTCFDCVPLRFSFRLPVGVMKALAFNRYHYPCKVRLLK